MIQSISRALWTTSQHTITKEATYRHLNSLPSSTETNPAVPSSSSRPRLSHKTGHVRRSHQPYSSSDDEMLVAP